MLQHFSGVSFNIDLQDKHTYDAIVIGSGISGGWAAKELCEHGMKTLVLERGRNVVHNQDYPTANLHPWQLQHRGQLTEAFLRENPLISKSAGIAEDNVHFFIRDKDHPYVQEKPFDWIRGYQVGGKSLIWGRACQRWSPYEFTAPARYGYGIDWPIRYEDVAPWYSHVEEFIGVCGNKDGIEAMPDGEFLPPFDLNCVEAHIQKSIRQNFANRHLVQARWAHITQPKEIHLKQGRGQCQARNLCMRGCPFGGYFSSNSSTLPWAGRTGNLTIRPHSVVHSIIYDEKKGKAAGVRIIDANSKEITEYFARVIFVNASALNSVLVLLNSKSTRFPNGLGNDNGLLGKFVAFHNYRASVNAEMPGFDDRYYYGRNPTEPIIANYRNLKKQDTDYAGGFTTFMGAGRSGWWGNTGDEMGDTLKKQAQQPGGWTTYMYMQGETIPKEKNHVRLSETQTDSWGIPLLITSVDYDDNDERMIKDFLQEMGGCRMGRDPKNSLLNKWNQLHACKNVFVTDGACMTSTGNQSPSILYMALTARAANYAVSELKKRNL
jgi:choline dehydrogenase-like flavoprotein